ncbi:hypothetical protein [Aurantibacillus circumpalustris]|nr:hypothetical protein [Aurantibacillus circumpalustris]
MQLFYSIGITIVICYVSPLDYLTNTIGITVGWGGGGKGSYSPEALTY